jgi:hypothetical protein
METVRASPVWGIGVTGDWIRPQWMGSSIDSLWLRSAVAWGLPSVALLASVMFAAGLPRTVGANRRLDADGVFAARILGIVIFGYAFAGMTVFFWGANWSLLAIVCGLRSQLVGFAKAAGTTHDPAPGLRAS